MNRINAESFRFHSDWACISIGSPGQPEVDFQCQKLYALLSLKFDDVDSEGAGYTIISDDDAKQIAWFVKKWYDEVPLIVVHCQAGLSRSTAICAAIQSYMQENERVYFDFFIPNSLVYRKVLDALNDNS